MFGKGCFPKALGGWPLCFFHPHLFRAESRMSWRTGPNPSPNSLGAGWEMADGRGLERRFWQKLADRGGVPIKTAISVHETGRERVLGRMCQDGWPAWEEGSFHSFAEDVQKCSGSLCGLISEEGCPCLDGQDHGLEWRSSDYVRSLDLRACWSAAPSYWPGWMSQRKYQGGVDRELRAPHNGSPLAITLILLSSCRLVWSRLTSLRRVLVVTLAPASRQTLAAALSKRDSQKGSLVPSKPQVLCFILTQRGRKVILPTIPLQVQFSPSMSSNQNFPTNISKPTA